MGLIRKGAGEPGVLNGVVAGKEEKNAARSSHVGNAGPGFGEATIDCPDLNINGGPVQSGMR